MKRCTMTEAEVRAVPQKNWGAFLVSSVGGSDEVYNQDANDIRTMYQEGSDYPGSYPGPFIPNPTLLDLIEWDTRGMSGNVHNLLCIHDGSICKLHIERLNK